MPVSRLRKNRWKGKGAKERARRIRRHNARVRALQRGPADSALAGAVNVLRQQVATDQIQDALASLEGRPPQQK